MSEMLYTEGSLPSEGIAGLSSRARQTERRQSSRKTESGLAGTPRHQEEAVVAEKMPMGEVVAPGKRASML